METTPKTKQKSEYRASCDSTDSNQDGSSTHKPMSASLKERLKRSRRTFSSPFTAKRLRIDPGPATPTACGADRQTALGVEAVRQTALGVEAVRQTALGVEAVRQTALGVEADREDVIDVNRNETTPRECPETSCAGAQSSVTTAESAKTSDTLQLRDKLKTEIKERTETLRRLKMVKMYRKKNDLTQLQGLVEKWRQCTQAILYELQTDLPMDGRKASLSQLIDHFGLEDSMLHFDRAEEDFTDT